MNIHQRINEVRKKIEYIKKDKTVQTYKAVTHDQVTALIRDHLVSAGIIIYPRLVSSITADTGTTTSSKTPIIRVEAVYEFTFVGMDEGDSVTVSVSAHANDQGDKAPGKALSYAKKAIMLKVFEIETGEDDESRYEPDPEPPKKMNLDEQAVWVKMFEGCNDRVQLKAAWTACMDHCKTIGDRDSADILKKAMMIIHGKLIPEDKP